MQNNGILVSVIIPVFNREKTLSCAVDSVLKVNSDKIELLLIDDGSTDGSGRLCDEYALKYTRVKVIHKENGGVSSARNAGIDNAKGKYVFFCDSDDCIYSDVLENSLNVLSESNIDVYMFDYIYNDIKAKKETKQDFNLIAETKLNKKEIVDKIIAPLVLRAGTGLAPLWHKLFLTKKIKDYNIRFEEKVYKGEDWRFVLDFVDVSESAYYISQPIYCYNLDGTQTEKKYKRVPGYHLLCSPKIRLALIKKYELDCKFSSKTYIFSDLISAVVFSSANKCNNREIKSMVKDDSVQEAARFLIKLKKSDYFRYEISRKNKFYSYLILLKSVLLLNLFVKKLLKTK